MNIVPEDFVAEQLQSVLSDMHVDVVSGIWSIRKNDLLSYEGAYFLFSLIHT